MRILHEHLTVEGENVHFTVNGNHYVAPVDIIPKLVGYCWYGFHKYRYLCREVPRALRAEQGRWVYLHALIMEPIPNGFTVDHIDQDTTNNRRENLRLVPKRLQMFNRVGWSKKRPYKGVSKTKGGVSWNAISNFDLVRKHLGSFPTPEEAAKAYDKAAVAHYGDNVLPHNLNLPDRIHEPLVYTKRKLTWETIEEILESDLCIKPMAAQLGICASLVQKVRKGWIPIYLRGYKDCPTNTTYKPSDKRNRTTRHGR